VPWGPSWLHTNPEQIYFFLGTVRKFKTNGKTSPKKLLISPNGKRLIVADSSIYVYEVETHQFVCKFAAHASDIRQLQFSNEGRYLLTCARQDRFINIYRMDNLSKAGAQPAPGLTMDHPVQCFDVQMIHGKEMIVAVNEQGKVCLWPSLIAASSKTSNQGGKKGSKRARFSARVPETVLSFQSKESQESISVTSGCFVITTEPRLLLTRGKNSSNPIFEILVRFIYTIR
jgi:WD40 repeat protein